MNKKNPVWGTGLWGCWGKSCRATWLSRAEVVILPCVEGRMQACGAVNECLRGSITFAAASRSPRALHLGFVVVLSLIWDGSKWV